MSNQRAYLIAKVILGAKGPIKTAKIGEQLNLSEKTIRNALGSTAKLVHGFSLTLVSKPGTGIFMEGIEADRLRFLAEMSMQENEYDLFSSKNRQLLIADMLLCGQAKVTMNFLEEYFYISRPSLYKDIEELKKWFCRFEIEVLHSRKNGLTLAGGEKRTRYALFNLLLEKERSREPELLGSTNPPSYIEIISSFTKTAFRYENSQFMEKIEQLLFNIEQVLDVKFTKTDMSRLTKRLFIAIWRIQSGNFASMRKMAMEELQSLPSFSSMKQITAKIFALFGAVPTQQEEFYLFSVIISSKTNRKMELYTTESSMNINRNINEAIVSYALSSYNISNTTEFKSELMNTICAIGNKINYGYDFYNPLEHEIEEKFPSLMPICDYSHLLFKKYYDYSVPRGELCYIALLTAAAIEREKKPLSTIIIYDYNYSEASYMVEMIRHHVALIHIVGVYPMYRLPTLDLYGVQLIISTEKIEPTGKPLLVLPTLPTYGDIITLYEHAVKIYEKNKET